MEVILAHGASGDATSMAPHVEGLRARGVPARAIDLPVRKAEGATGAYLAAAGDLTGRVIGGHSYGGRVASLLAASADPGPAGLVLLSYPLHRPGSPDWDIRTAHWPSIHCPVLLLSGEADPFARIDLLREAVAQRLPGARLITWPRLGHGLKPVLDEALDRLAAFVRELGGEAASSSP
jgi:predicted alpha/beta-hydrolase family hydrolase